VVQVQDHQKKTNTVHEEGLIFWLQFFKLSKFLP